MVELVEIDNPGHNHQTWVFANSTSFDVEDQDLQNLLDVKSYTIGVSRSLLIVCCPKKMTNTIAQQNICTIFRSQKLELRIRDGTTFTPYHAELFGFRPMAFMDEPRCEVPEITWLPRAPAELYMPKDRRLSNSHILQWIFLRAGSRLGTAMQESPSKESWQIFWQLYKKFSHIKTPNELRSNALKLFLSHCASRGLQLKKEDLKEELDSNREPVPGRCYRCNKEIPRYNQFTDLENRDPLESNLGKVFFERYEQASSTTRYTVPGPGPRRTRRFSLEGLRWMKHKAAYGIFCSKHCVRDLCKLCGVFLELDRNLQCKECKGHPQVPELRKIPYLGSGDGVLPEAVQYGSDLPRSFQMLRWPGCYDRNKCGIRWCAIHCSCDHICKRNCDHSCYDEFFMCRKNWESIGEIPSCTCPPEMVERFREEYYRQPVFPPSEDETSDTEVEAMESVASSSRDMPKKRRLQHD